MCGEHGVVTAQVRRVALAYAERMTFVPEDTTIRPALAAATSLFPFLPDSVASPIRGGRKAALAAMAKLDPARYTRSRNFLSGAVSQLSPYLRHGVLTLAEVRDFTLHQVSRAEDAEKFINELGWRDYWQRLYAVLGEDIWTDLEAYKTGFRAVDYGEALPDSLRNGTTGLVCMDSFSRDLQTEGWLHNHARMWMAAYLVHWLRVRWQTGARWFLQHLIDGDPASNNLSWQWVASTFAQKPYFFNRENLERYTDGRYCSVCPLRGHCPMEGSYEELEQRLFRAPDGQAEARAPRLLRSVQPAAGRQMQGGSKPLLWIHTDGLNPASPLFTSFPEAPAVFVWDERWMRENGISSKRAVFLEECLEELPAGVERRSGDVAAELLAAAVAAGADAVVAQRTPDPALLAAAAEVSLSVPVIWVDVPAFADGARGYDLNRFSKYWRQAQASALRLTR